MTRPVGTSASAMTRNTMATMRDAMTARISSHSGAVDVVSRGTEPAMPREMGPDTSSASTPASSSRIRPNRTPSRRRAAAAMTATSPSTVTTTATQTARLPMGNDRSRSPTG
ncbi:hypothetical protein OHA72_54090 [Dactylosporangium sp. NBC_01737]|uniref:hypothetical protein n=1 Tax=Dactylosporangium sp. NBC_01737 TaxID=2975959 RepID=UPI002E0EF494|nr:hypothetical protein OHA72_54090 [Dactylosporangium sp. NBC_01737]